jgi:amphi-Trp domain-containing protein
MGSCISTRPDTARREHLRRLIRSRRPPWPARPIAISSAPTPAHSSSPSSGALADSLETERPVTIQVAGERLRIPTEVRFNIEHERAGGEDELEFQLLWRSGE